jgi:mannosyltransferase OCH1-like enzyme
MSRSLLNPVVSKTQQVSIQNRSTHISEKFKSSIESYNNKVTVVPQTKHRKVITSNIHKPINVADETKLKPSRVQRFFSIQPKPQYPDIFKTIQQTIVADDLTTPSNSIIPLNLYQTWPTLDLPHSIREQIESLKRKNPEFTYYLYDEQMCREYISTNFPEEVLYTFDKLKPLSYKFNLAHYCLLYKNGGVYLDIKHHCVNGFKLVTLTDSEYFVRDKYVEYGICPDFMIVNKYNHYLLEVINNIVDNVKNVYYDNGYVNSYMITGELLLAKYITPQTNPDNILIFSECGHYVDYNNSHIIKVNTKKPSTDESVIMYSKANIYNFVRLQSVNVVNLSSQMTKSINGTDVTFYSSNVCIIRHPSYDDKYLLNIRWIDYSLNSDGNSTMTYIKNISLNSYIILDNAFNVVQDNAFLSETPDYNEPYDNFGLEDVRLFQYSNKLYYIASALDRSVNTISITTDECVLQDNTYTMNTRFIRPTFYNNVRVEKNWCFVVYKERLCIIYKWSPLTICEIHSNDHTLNIVEQKEIKPELFVRVKGSTPGYLFNNEIWFVVHISQNRNYQHLFAIFDTEMNLLRYSEPFKLDDCLVEFCIGLIVEVDRIILSFSTLDINIYVATYDHSYIHTIKWYNNI